QDVRAELVRARAAGEVATSEAVVALPAPVAQPSGLTRAQVTAELIQARAEGLDARNAEYGTYANNNTASTRSREEVKAEAVAATRGKRAGVQAGH
ncbi:MAG TPA: DUF4148 domain-containing protein, partial [Rhizobacter sp.]|nr:DUF4148 domain-containing protein [Rhizobacter sp.]